MTPPEDNQRDEPAGPPEGPVEPQASVDPPLDEAALWAAIVANYGDRVQLHDLDDPDGPSATEDLPPVGAAAAARPVDPPEGTGLPHEDPARWEREEHFVPPEPPPLPRGTPARRLAWSGLLVPPVVMVLAVALGWALPTWASFLLVVAFVGGFVFLVATMPRDGGDGWGDGAVV